MSIGRFPSPTHLLHPAALFAFGVLVSLCSVSEAQIRISNGGSSSAIPAFGGYDPGAAGRFGFQNNNFGLGLTFGKGSTRSNSLGGTSVLLPNGGYGSFFSGTVNHFVTGVTPVVGGRYYGPYRRPYYRYPYGHFNPYCFPYYHSPFPYYSPYGYGRPIGYGIQTAPFAAPGSVWLNYPGPAVSNNRVPNVRSYRPSVSRLNMLLKQNGGPNRTVNLSSSPPKANLQKVDQSIANRIPTNSRNSTADKAVKSLAEIRKEMKARKAAEIAFRKAQAEKRKQKK